MFFFKNISYIFHLANPLGIIIPRCRCGFAHWYYVIKRLSRTIPSNTEIISIFRMDNSHFVLCFCFHNIVSYWLIVLAPTNRIGLLRDLQAWEFGAGYKMDNSEKYTWLQVEPTFLSIQFPPFESIINPFE